MVQAHGSGFFLVSDLKELRIHQRPNDRSSHIAFVELTYCARQRDGEAEELCDLHRLPDQPIERLTTCVIDHQHRLAALAYQLKRPQCPGAVQVALEFVLVHKAIDAVQSRVLCSGRDWYERVLLALAVMAA